MSRVVKFWIGLLLAFTAFYGSYAVWGRYQPVEVFPAGPSAGAQPLTGFEVRPFKLTERSGEEFDSASLQGKVWVASFFFANCAGACLKMNNALAELRPELADAPVTFVSITVDPQNDTPERLREYAAHYQADPRQWVFLTGDVKTIQRVAIEDFKVPFALATHSDRLILVDRQGQVQGYYRGTDPTQVTLLKRKLLELLEDPS